MSGTVNPLMDQPGALPAQRPMNQLLPTPVQAQQPRQDNDAYYIPPAPSGVAVYPIPSPPSSFATDAVALPPDYYKASNYIDTNYPNHPRNDDLKLLLQMMYTHQKGRT